MYNYLIIENNESVIQSLQEVLKDFDDFYCLGITKEYKDSMNIILKETPSLVFLNLDTALDDPFLFVHELNTYSSNSPTFIGISKYREKAYDALKNGLVDLLLSPISMLDIRKSLLVFQKKNTRNRSRKICIKSYKDFKYLNADDILFLKADNNTTEFHLKSGRVVHAFKTLKTFENSLPKNFIRVHKSYILNKNHVTRIQFGKYTCSIRKESNEFEIPFSKTYLENIECMKSKLNQFSVLPLLN